MATVRGPYAGFCLFGQTGIVQWDLVIAVTALVAVVSVGIWAIYKIKRWREEAAEEAPLTPEELLQHYQKMVEEGTLDPQEFARIKAQIDQKSAAAPQSKPPDSPIRE